MIFQCASSKDKYKICCDCFNQFEKSKKGKRKWFCNGTFILTKLHAECVPKDNKSYADELE